MTTTRPKLGLKPAEKERAIQKGLLAGLVPPPVGKPTRQEPSGASIAPPQVSAPVLAPDRPANGRLAAPDPAADPKLTMAQRLAQAFGVEKLRWPFALGIGKGQPKAVRYLIANLVQRPAYLRALIASEHRYAPDGSVSGSVSPEHKAYAAARLEQLAARGVS